MRDCRAEHVPRFWRLSWRTHLFNASTTVCVCVCAYWGSGSALCMCWLWSGMSSVGAALWTVSCYSPGGCSMKLPPPQVSMGRANPNSHKYPQLQSVNIFTAFSCDPALQHKPTCLFLFAADTRKAAEPLRNCCQYIDHIYKKHPSLQQPS